MRKSSNFSYQDFLGSHDSYFDQSAPFLQESLRLRGVIHNHGFVPKAFKYSGLLLAKRDKCDWHWGKMKLIINGIFWNSLVTLKQNARFSSKNSERISNILVSNRFILKMGCSSTVSLLYLPCFYLCSLTPPPSPPFPQWLFHPPTMLPSLIIMTLRPLHHWHNASILTPTPPPSLNTNPRHIMILKG